MKKIIKKLKNSWNQNRVLFVLTTILVVCVVLIFIVAIDYFLGTSKDKYGDRLDGIKSVEVTKNEITKLENKIKEDDKIIDCEIHQIGKVIYVNIKFNGDITLVEAEGKALNTIELFSEKERKFYDLNYSLLQDATDSNAGFSIMGTKNVNGTGLVWNNNTPVNEE